MQQDSADIPLTDLCAICHVNPIKYTCPRDGIHTCSLPCVKRHKQWAQCSGVRDPAEYRKRSELATATSIDKDFNFIAKVERSISRADDVLADKGIDLVPARLRPNDTRPKVELETEARGIKVIKAPKGLSRSKQNKTHWGVQTKCIVWTIEWIREDGRKIMSAAPETKSVKDLFDAAAGPKRYSRKRKRPSDTADKKLMLEVKHIDGVEPTNDAPSTHLPPQESTNVATPSPSAQDAPNTDHTKEETEIKSKEEQPIVTASEPYFYLHRPNTESRYKCLIPISATATLQQALENKTLIEFPTIYVRNESPDQLSQPFISEETYVQRHGQDIPINLSVPVETTAIDSGELEDGELITDQISLGVDEAKVLELLAQDLTS